MGKHPIPPRTAVEEATDTPPVRHRQLRAKRSFIGRIDAFISANAQTSALPGQTMPPDPRKRLPHMKKLLPLILAAAEITLSSHLHASEPVTAVSTPANAGVRTWTAQDGRTLQAEFISATKEVVTVRRTDGVTVTILLKLLSPDDVAWVSRQPKPVEVTQEQIDRIVQKFPNAPRLGNGEVTNELKQLHEKYLSMVKFIRPGTITPNLKMIRDRKDADIKVLTEIAMTGRGNGSGRRMSGQSSSAENSILSARRSLGWLQGSLTPYLNSFDSLVKPK
jgi:hypothetical protein